MQSPLRMAADHPTQLHSTTCPRTRRWIRDGGLFERLQRGPFGTAHRTKGIKIRLKWGRDGVRMRLHWGYNYNGTVSSVTLLHRLPVSTKGFRAFRNRALSSRKRARQVRGRLLTPTFQLRKHLRPPPPGTILQPVALGARKATGAQL